MNIENINTAISIMTRARRVLMNKWQTVQPGMKIVITEEELHACGNAACFGGHVAVSQEFRNIGGRAHQRTGLPVLTVAVPPLKPHLPQTTKVVESWEAIAVWLGISPRTASCLCLGGNYRRNGQLEPFYTESLAQVTAQDVISKLELIKLGYYV